MTKKRVDNGERIVWADIVRVVATFLVIMAHSCDPYVFFHDFNSEAYLNGSLLSSLTRPSVPLFAMLTGMLLLPVNGSVTDFYKRRFTRVLYPFIIWAVLYAVIPFLLGHSMNESAGDFTSSDMITGILMIPVNFTLENIHFWYLYMLIGLYLFMPVISPWIKQASKGALRWFLAAWAVTLFLPYVREYGIKQILGEADWNIFHTFYYFSGFIGYVILGYYLNKYPIKWKFGAIALVFIPLWILSWAATINGFQWVVDTTGKISELFFGFDTINVVLMTLSVFVIIQRINIGPGIARNIFEELSKKSFGIFLVHYFIINLIYPVFDKTELPAIAKIPLEAVVTFVISYMIVKVISYIPKSKYIIG